MKALNQSQSDQIRTDVDRANLSIHSLKEELIDHICCEVERLMEEGKTFDEAYRIMSEHSGITVLQEIEENTLMLTNKHYRIMKTTMKLSGTASLSLIAIGTLLRIMHLAGADITLVLGFILLTFLFIPAAVFLDFTTSQEKQIVKRAALLSGCIALCNGVLFKVMHWSGANFMLIIGFIVMMGLFLPQVIAAQLKNQSTKWQKLLSGLGALSLFIFASGTLFKLMHWPGTAILFISGSLLLIGIFIPAYSFLVLQKKEKAMAPFIYLVILSIYVITMTGLISVSPVPPVSEHSSAAPAIQTH